MADYHVLPGNRLAVHVPVPNENNEVGEPYRGLLVVTGQNTTVLADAVDPEGWEITAAEKAQIDAGEVVEDIKSWDLMRMAGTPAQKKAKILDLIVKWTPKILKDTLTLR